MAGKSDKCLTWCLVGETKGPDESCFTKHNRSNKMILKHIIYTCRRNFVGDPCSRFERNCRIGFSEKRGWGNGFLQKMCI